MQFNSINFPDELIASLRAGKCVVFAGAGVSMGEPANLPDFNRLAKIVAAGSGEERNENEPTDRFLGRLLRSGVAVHERVSNSLTLPSGHFAPLHTNLVRLFSKHDLVRIVTTNFDSLFEEAAMAQFGNLPDIYRSPALPLGSDFAGIVHVHGHLDHIRGMVVTDADFGRGYLTEGWARRFLVDLFRTYTVLFVGYSHEDIVLEYLSRALPESTVGQRFTLIGEDVEQGEWLARGIEPISFPKPGKRDYTVLCSGIEQLANYLSRTMLDWKRELTGLAAVKPPQDEESEHQILDALSDEKKVRFFTNTASDKDWLSWLDSRGVLDNLFLDGKLNERDQVLANWLAKNYAYQFPNELILVIANHGLKVNNYFWWILGQEIGMDKQSSDHFSPETLAKWVSVLLSAYPTVSDDFVIGLLGERCSEAGNSKCLIELFIKLVECRLKVKKEFNWHEDEEISNETLKLDIEYKINGDHWCLNEFYEKHLKPILHEVAISLLDKSVYQIERIHRILWLWGKSDENWDRMSYGRSAIEPHEQDRIQDAEDVLINVARDCLESLGETKLLYAHSFFLKHCNSEVPLFRRLCVHFLAERGDIDAEAKLDIFLNEMNLHEVPSHHEIFRLMGLIYPKLDADSRGRLVKEVLAYEWPNPETGALEERAAYVKFNWLDWLRKADPECELLENELNALAEKFPDLQPSEHQDFTYWKSGGEWVGPVSPWSVNELLARSASEWFEQLLSFKGNEFRGPDRRGMCQTLSEAVKNNPPWGTSLAKELADKDEWQSDLWGALIDAWKDWPDNQDYRADSLHWLADERLFPRFSYDISRCLYALVEGDGKLNAVGYLNQAHEVAMLLWPHVSVEEYPEEKDDWLLFAINSPAGILAEFWVHGLSLWWKAQKEKPESLPDQYSKILERVLHEHTPASGVALTVIASQFSYFLSIDHAWTERELLPCFDRDNNSLRMQQSWDGFLSWGRLNQRVFDVLHPLFLKAAACLNTELASYRDRFAEFFAVLVIFYLDDPLKEAIPAFYKGGEEEDWRNFARHVGHLLRGLNEEQQAELWGKWLKSYWEGRIHGIPKALTSGEVNVMLEWPLRLKAIFPEAVRIAGKLPLSPFEHLSVGHDLMKENLDERYPNDVAKLLVLLMKTGSPKYVYYGFDKVIQRLPEDKVDPDVWAELQGTAQGLGII
ncbi:MAG: DUF4020 domain-containing protein [Gammaproteobacteria bacterium]|nr:DUF4020 domain-containing protein [Gammaproteobacteria bacterium]